MPASEPQGLIFYGAKTLLKSSDESAISGEPVYMPASAIDDAIARGLLREGSLNDIATYPMARDWPDRWKFLVSFKE